MMKTPICDFVKKYVESDALRLHMPGHKGVSFIGIESLDITEIDGADSLYEAGGIIKESEDNASALFGCPTYYSTEGASHSIRAMLYLISLYAGERGERPRIFAAMNAHKVFLSAAALLDLDVEWLEFDGREGYLSCLPDAKKLDAFLQSSDKKPTAIYLTSPDYLGNIADIKAISAVCKKYGVLLAVDNAHGAYLRFLTPSQHPIDLGADICCDSAHKTLPALTGAAYLHISNTAPRIFVSEAKNALALFGSTSPSYLILQSLDRLNLYLSSGYNERLSSLAERVKMLKTRLSEVGYTLYGNETTKITLATKAYGYTGTDFAKILAEKSIVCEYADPDFIVFMLTDEIGEEGLSRLENALLSVPKMPPIATDRIVIHRAERVMSIRDAMLSPCERVTTANALGRILAQPSVSCPPAVPIAFCGEKIDEKTLLAFDYYGIKELTVVKK